MTDKKMNRLPLIAFASLPLTVGLVLAQTTPSSTAGTGTATTGTTAQAPQRVQPTQPGQRPQGTATTAPQGTGTNYADVFLQKLAAQLGVSVDRLKAAAITAGSATIDQGVKAGDFPNDLATRLKQDLQQRPFALAGGRGLPGGFGPGGDRGQDDGGPRGERGPGPMGQGEGAASGAAVRAAVARALGLTEQTLAQQLQNGQTIEQLAQARGVTTASLHAAAVTALKTQLSAEVKSGRLTQAQADEHLSRAQADPNFGLHFGRGMPRGPQGQTNSD